MASKKKAAAAVLGTKVASRAARGAGRAALRGGKGQARLVGRALSPREPAPSRYLKYGLFALVGFAVGALVARLGGRAGQHGETWGSAAGTVSDPASPAARQRPEDPHRTGPEREYSDPTSGPLIGRSHRAQRDRIPTQHQEIENRIRTRVGEDPRTMHVTRLNVEVNDDVADIRGEVHSEEEKRAVEEIAAGVEGVTEVRNLLTVNPQAPGRRDKAAGGDGAYQ